MNYQYKNKSSNHKRGREYASTSTDRKLVDLVPGLALAVKLPI